MEFSGKVLVVDDSPDIREALSSFLELLGYSVVRAADGMEALAALKAEGDITLVISDLMMPRMDAFGLSAAMRGDETLRRIPLVLMSASHSPEKAAAQMGAIACLGKPFDIQDLVSLLQRCPL